VGLFGFGGNRFDEGLPDKINNLLAGQKSPKDKINEFLENTLGVDPKSLRLKYPEAVESLQTILDQHRMNGARFDGNSLGLKAVHFLSTQDGPEVEADRHNHSEWHELSRIYVAFQEDTPGMTLFTAFAEWDGMDVRVAVRDIPSPDPTTYPSGTVLQVTRDAEVEYVRVGGPFSDTEVIILNTLRPIEDPGSWTVTEVL
jgi:hypothetical protein